MLQVYINPKLLLIICLCSITISFSVQAKKTSKPPFIAGKHYVRISPAVLKNETVKNFIAQDPKKTQVLSFFSYGCYGCSLLQPSLEAWADRRSKKIQFYRIPVIFHPSWRIFSKVYYVLEESEKLQKIDRVLFKAIHSKGKKLYTKSKLRKFLIEKGMKGSEFDNLMDSFLVEQRVVHALNLTKGYKVTISPSVVINTKKGSFFTDLTMAGSEKKLLKVMDYLLKKNAV